jgi:tetrahydromethanopterin S-methyltransferase subunit D
VSAVVLLSVALVEASAGATLGLVFDGTFVVVCVAAALLVRPRDFFGVGVLPPLSMLAIVAILAAVDRTSVADATDGFGQATVSGLAHHAGALVVGYALTLGLLALRQVALRNAGAIRQVARPHGSAAARSTTARRARPVSRQRRTRVPEQRQAAPAGRRVG